MKRCPQCDITYENERTSFVRDRHKKSGLDSICKNCRKEYRKKNKDRELSRWKQYYSPNSEARKRHMIRSLTRKKHGSAKLHKCNHCGSAAEEWHHTEYKVDTAIPLCSNCHECIR